MKSFEHIHRRAFGIPPTGRDRKATLKQSKLPLGQLQLSLHSPLVHMRDPAGHSEGWLKLEHIHLNPLPASTNGCSPVLERQWNRRKVGFQAPVAYVDKNTHACNPLCATVCNMHDSDSTAASSYPWKQSSLPSIASQLPRCASLLQSVWRIELLFILLHLHIVCPLL